MANGRKRSAMAQYQDVDVDVAVSTADPHQLVLMLMDGALKNIHRSKALMEKREIKEKAQAISKAVAIVDSLKASLNYEVGGELVANLEALYDYMTTTLVVANSMNDSSKLDEVAGLMEEVRSGWAQVRKQVKQPQKSVAAHPVPVDGSGGSASLSFSA